MIALTQEKREELKAFLSASIEKRCTVYTLAKQRELEALRDKIAIASLTSLPFGWEIAGNTFPTLEEALKPGYIGRPEPIYYEPPVPEIKLPSNLQDAFEDENKIPPNTQRCGDSYCVSTFHNWKGEEFMHQFEGFLKGVNCVKRLNGLGE